MGLGFSVQNSGLSPKSTRLVFKAMIYHGMGHEENQWIRIGADDTKEWDVLWLRTDWDEGTVPLIWVAKGTLRGRALRTGLVHAWLGAATIAEDAPEPPDIKCTPAYNPHLTPHHGQPTPEQVTP